MTSIVDHIAVSPECQVEKRAEESKHEVAKIGAADFSRHLEEKIQILYILILRL